jgi:GNAT superfamily N-acetyltransferase
MLNQNYNLMKIKQLKTKHKKFDDFKMKEWKLVHPEHYGVEFDEDYWDTKHLYLEAVDGRKIVGALVGVYVAGVLYIDELITKHTHRGKGIGKTLLETAEEWVRKRKGHELYLATGTKWQARDFYSNLGYKLAANMPKHYSKADFVLLRKFLD